MPTAPPIIISDILEGKENIPEDVKKALPDIGPFTIDRASAIKLLHPEISPKGNAYISDAIDEYLTRRNAGEEPSGQTEVPKEKHGGHQSHHEERHHAQYIEEDHTYHELAHEKQQQFEEHLNNKFTDQYGKDWKRNKDALKQAQLEMDQYVNGQAFPADRNTRSLKSDTLKAFYKDHKEKKHTLHKQVKATEAELEKLKVSHKSPLVRFVQVKLKTRQLKKEQSALDTHNKKLERYHENEQKRVHEHPSNDWTVQQTQANISRHQRRVERQAQKAHAVLERQKEEIHRQTEETIKKRAQGTGGTYVKQMESLERQKATRRIQDIEQKQQQVATHTQIRKEKIEQKHWDKFVQNNPIKAKSYALPRVKATHADTELTRTILQAKQRVEAAEERKRQQTVGVQTTTIERHATPPSSQSKPTRQQMPGSFIHPTPQTETAQHSPVEPEKRSVRDRLLGRQNHAPSGLYGGRYGARGKMISAGASKAPRLNMGLLRGRISSVLKGASFGSRFIPRGSGQQEQDQQQQQRQPTFQFPNIINAGNDIYNTAQNVKTAIQVAQKAAQVARVAVAAANPFTWIVLAIIIGITVLVVLIIVVTGGGMPLPEETLQTPPQNTNNPTPPGTQTIPGLIMEKTGPVQVNNGEEIVYTISGSYTGTADVTISDTIPTNTTYESTTGINPTINSGTIQWKIDDQAAPDPNAPTQSRPYSFTLTLKPTADDIIVQNTLEATAIGGTVTISGDIQNLLPNPLPPETDGVQKAREEIQALLAKNPGNIAVYKEAAAQTGIPWQVLAGKHYIEGSMGANKSLVSGRTIGTDEPDVRRSGGGCSSGSTGPGKAVPVPGGCGFNTLLDSAIYAGNHLKSKIGGNPPQSFEELVKALSRYNGGGNSNCGRGVPYHFCPPDFEGEDDPYPMNYFDTKHNLMYLIYCADLTKCNPPKIFPRPGVMTIIRAISELPY